MPPRNNLSLAFTSKKDCVKEERSIFHKPRVGFRKNVYRVMVTIIRPHLPGPAWICNVIGGSLSVAAGACVG